MQSKMSVHIRKGVQVAIVIFVCINIAITLIVSNKYIEEQNEDISSINMLMKYKRDGSKALRLDGIPIKQTFVYLKGHKLYDTKNVVSINESSVGRKQPAVWYPDRQFKGHRIVEYDPMRYHYLRVFRRLGYKFVQNNSEEWDILWKGSTSLEKLAGHIHQKLKPHQKVHGIPGTRIITSKKRLVKLNLPYIPKSYKLPEEVKLFKNYINNNGRGKQWLLKGGGHNGQDVIHISDQDAGKIQKEDFSHTHVVQELIPNPFLVGGRKFDLAVYIAVTSIDPLRVYMDAGDWFIRYCPKPYYPFDPAIRDKYVIIRETFNATWEVPELRDAWYQESLNNKQALLWYIRNQGLDPSLIEEQIAFIIRDIFIKAEPEINDNFHQRWQKLASGGNFFEFYRLDFLLDNKLNVHLIELNDGPGMGSRRHKERWRQNERTIFSMLHLMGMAPSTGQYLLKASEEERDMQISKHELVTFNEFCLKNNCTRDRCDITAACSLCMGCWDEDILDILTLAAHEHYNRNDWTRVMPKPFSSQENALQWDPTKDAEFPALSQKSKLIYRWFRGKCLQNKGWC